jgi:uncharacterized repeat protein (TIGR01451 family)
MPFPIAMKKILSIILSCICIHAYALDPSHFTVTRVTAPYFVVDANAPSTGPLTCYVGFKITNTSASTSYSAMKFTITSIGTSVVGQNYTLVSPSSGISLVGTLAAGASKVCYFYVTYPANVTPQATFNYSLSDATASSKTGSFIIVNRSAISANAGGLATQSINNEDLIGGIVYDDVTYTLGNIRNGDESDFQISVSTQFDPTKLTLLKTEVISSTVPGVAAGTLNQLYYTTTANQSTGTVTIRWTFKITGFNFTVLILPYAGATSGASNYKYAISTDLGSGTPITISSSANPLLISKTSDKTTYGANNTAIFTVTISNPGPFAISIDKITDEIPAGFSYVALDGTSQVTAVNSTSMPAAGATGTITFEGGVTAGANTSYQISTGGTLILKYTATAPSVQASNLQTTARGYIGVTQFGFAQNTVNVSTTLPVTLTAFKASWENNGVMLSWATESENNSSHFVVERNTGSGFVAITQIAAIGNTTNSTSYSCFDSTPAPGSNVYRLKMVDADGKFKYSSVVSLFKESQGFQVNGAYPNPFANEVRLNLSVAKQQMVQFNLYDYSGQLLFSKNQSCTQGMNSVTLDNLRLLPKGAYLLSVQCEDGKSTQQLRK